MHNWPMLTSSWQPEAPLLVQTFLEEVVVMCHATHEQVKVGLYTAGCLEAPSGHRAWEQGHRGMDDMFRRPWFIHTPQHDACNTRWQWAVGWFTHEADSYNLYIYKLLHVIENWLFLWLWVKTKFDFTTHNWILHIWVSYERQKKT